MVASTLRCRCRCRALPLLLLAAAARAVDASGVAAGELKSGTGECGNGTWSVDVDYTGEPPPGVKPVKGLSKDACCQLCLSHPDCAAVTWNGPDGTWKDGGCNLKLCIHHSPCHRKTVPGQLSCKVRQGGSETPPPLPADPEEDGSEAWLRYRLVAPAVLQSYRTVIQRAAVAGPPSGGSREDQAQLKAAASELTRGLTAMGVLDNGATVTCCAPSPPAKGTLLVRVDPTQATGPGFVVSNGGTGLVMQAATPSAALDAVFHILQLLLRAEPLPWSVAVKHKPAMELRIWDLWDNLDGGIERGFGGNSVIWPFALDARASSWTAAVAEKFENMARLLKSSGLNGIVLNNVNACGNNAKLLSPDALSNVSASAYPILAKWGLTTYITPCYAAPMSTGMGQPPLSGVDPLDPKVIAWWATKSAEINQLMPSFGGFLVKADSEGNKGPLGCASQQCLPFYRQYFI